jgi:hypothetical protein
MTRLLLLLIACSLLCACYRTHYVNFSPRTRETTSALMSEEPERGAWRHFFIWGWVPDERAIDARAACGGAQNIESIQTQRTFVEGLVAAFAGYYINVYSPWNGAVYCSRAPLTPDPAAPAVVHPPAPGQASPEEAPEP